MKFFVVSFIFLLGLPAIAAVNKKKTDYQTNTLLRTQNVGFYTNAIVGRSRELWRNDKANFLYGFVRAGATAQTSFLVNSIMPQLDFYPISILGFYIGKDITRRDLNVPNFDCINEVTCKGWMDREFVGSRMALAFKDFYLMSEYRLSRANGQKANRRFAEERSSLIGHADHDYLHRKDLILGFKLTDQYSIGYLGHHNHMQLFKNSSFMQMGFVRYQQGDWNFLFGNGTFRSRDDKTFYSSLFIMQWNGSKGMLIF